MPGFAQVLVEEAELRASKFAFQLSGKRTSGETKKNHFCPSPFLGSQLQALCVSPRSD